MNTKRMMKPMEYALAAALAALVAGCGGGGGGGDGGGGGGTTPPPVAGTPVTTPSLGGTVAGLAQGGTVTLKNGSEELAVPNGTFTFATKLNTGAAYDVTAVKAPEGYTCGVTKGKGTAASANITDVAVACAPVLLAGRITAMQDPQDVASDSAGNLYVIDGDQHSVMKFAPTGAVTTLAGGTGKPGLADGPGASARFRFFGSSDVVSDAQGNLFVSDECNGAIRKIAADGTVSTLAGSGTTFCNNVVAAAGAATRADGTGTGAKFERPMRMVSDGAGGVVVIDSIAPGSSSVRRVSANGVVTTQTWAPPANLTSVPTFFAIARGNDGTLYLSDFDGQIWKDAGATLTLVAGNPSGPRGLGSADGTGASARFSAITDMVVAPNGDLYVSDFSMVRKVVLATGQVTTVAGSPTRGFTDGQGSAARFTSIRGMGLEGSNLIVIDNDQGALRRVTLDGKVTTLASTPAVRGHVDGPGALARFNWHTSLAADSTGALYMADSAAHTIRKVAADGTVATFAGKVGAAATADGPIASATFDAPRAVAAGRDTSVWVAQARGLRRIANGAVSTVDAAMQATSLAVDANGNAIVTANTTVNNVTTYTVQRVTANGAKEVLVDAAKVAALVPGARFVPQSVVLDAAGNIYISDTGTVVVYKLTPAGVLSVFAGTPLKEAGDIDGPSGTATLGFYEVEYMTIDDKGNLYLSGQGGVRMISPAGVVSTPSFAWGNATIGAVTFANGKLYGMTRYALLQNYLP